MIIDTAKRIHDSFEDDLSKAIFLDRLCYSISGKKEYIDSVLNITVRSSTEWTEFKTLMMRLKKNDTVLFGCGIWGKTVLTEIGDYSWKYIIDNSPKTEELNGIPVISAKRFLDRYAGESIVISSYKNRDAMMDQCIEAGVDRNQIIDAAGIIYSLTEGRIYLDEDLPLFIKDGFFIDGGCFDGNDSKRYLDRYDGEAICFEPDQYNAEKIRERLKEYEKRYQLVPAALWSSCDDVFFSSEGRRGSHIGGNKTGEKVRASSIDTIVGDRRASLIKMDIEGAELEALKGAKNTIIRDHPILAISAYHKPKDIIDIPLFILNLHECYRLYLRHYSFSWYDTVLYAIPKGDNI